MPIDWILVRHGESEGNLLNEMNREAKKAGKSIIDIIGKAVYDEFLSRHSSAWRLTDKGIWQAEQAGKWLHENGFSTFERAYVSNYLRAQETAGHLKLENVRWYREYFLRERDWGQMENAGMVPIEEEEMFRAEFERRKRDGFYWAPPGGESLAHLSLRLERVVSTLHRECSEMRVVTVCHGEVMWAFRVRMERMSQTHFQELDNSKHPFDRIHNCQIIQYTRRNPLTGELAPHMLWFRSICPWDMTLSRNSWEEIKRPKFTNEELLADAAVMPRLIN
jgi:NAD+ kinase